MNTIDQLIAHFENRIVEIDDEIERILHLPERKHTKTADHDHWIAGWKESREIARDSISYLKTLQRMQRDGI